MVKRKNESAATGKDIPAPKGTRKRRPRLTPNKIEESILWHLHRKPRSTQPEIAKELGLTQRQVRNAMEGMRKTDKEWIEDGYRIDPTILGFPERYRVDISLIPRNLKTGIAGFGDAIDAKIKIETQWDFAKYIVDNLSQRDQFKYTVIVENVSVLLGGSADLSATVRAKNNGTMLNFVTNGLRMCGAISNTSTCLEQKSYPAEKL
jgi:DNA-binding Lrp family transcriptional regulator